MLDKLNKIEKEALESLAKIEDEAALEAWRVANIGRSSPVMGVFSQMGGLSKEERPVVGQRANQVKVAIESAFAEKQEAIKQAALAKSLSSEKLDVTMPGRPAPRGRPGHLDSRARATGTDPPVAVSPDWSSRAATRKPAPE